MRYSKTNRPRSVLSYCMGALLRASTPCSVRLHGVFACHAVHATFGISGVHLLVWTVRPSFVTATDRLHRLASMPVGRRSSRVADTQDAACSMQTAACSMHTTAWRLDLEGLGRILQKNENHAPDSKCGPARWSCTPYQYMCAQDGPELPSFRQPHAAIQIRRHNLRSVRALLDQ